MSRKIIGISAYYHDSAAALIIDGTVAAAAQEERFTRIKHTPDFPSNALDFCLEETGTLPEDIDAVVFYDKPLLKFERLLETYYAFSPRGFRSFMKAMPVWLREKLLLKKILRDELVKHGIKTGKKTPLLFTDHHLSHAASTFYPSGFNEAAILTIDGVGEWCTASISKGSGNRIEILKELHFPHSVGLLYSAFTYFLGFTVNSGEYKLMGLAPYGNPNAPETSRYVDLIKAHLVQVYEDGSIWLNQEYFNYATGLEMVQVNKWEQLFGMKKRHDEEDLSAHYCNLALAIQIVTEEIVLAMASEAKRLTGSDRICLAGGVALNCVANGKLLRTGLFKNMYIQPASGDAGGALGAALAIHHMYTPSQKPGGSPTDTSAALAGNTLIPTGISSQQTDNPPSQYESRETTPSGRVVHRDIPPPKDSVHTERKVMQGSYLGPWYSDKDVTRMNLRNKAVSRHHTNTDMLVTEVARLLADGNVVGWFQGRMEFGPRALGNRSILADPRRTDMQKKLNLKIKYREGFRPFAPSVLEEYAADFFDLRTPSPYMLLVCPIADTIKHEVAEGYEELPLWDRLYTTRSDLPSITHVDFSARVQTVNKLTNERYWKLIDAFRQVTGVPVLVNTSFNVRGEPIVCTPDDAYRCFMSTEMDVLVINDHLYIKEEQPDHTNRDKWMRTFKPD